MNILLAERGFCGRERTLPRPGRPSLWRNRPYRRDAAVSAPAASAPFPPGETASSSPGRLVRVTEVARTKAELATALASLEGTSALVMTMGALHEGHLALVRAAREAADNVVVSIFVNPLQFGPDEDYEEYPRDLAADLALLGTVGVEAVYAPEAAEVYPREPLVRIDPGPVAALLEGKTRPTHFAGVLQVVHKVLNLVRPDMAFFGQKDAQQLALVRTMVADLDMPVEIRAVPIERDVDGLAGRAEVAKILGDELPEGPFDTIGGFVVNELGRMPEVGDEVRWGRRVLRVRSLEGRRISWLRVTEEEEEPDGVQAEDG